MMTKHDRRRHLLVNFGLTKSWKIHSTRMFGLGSGIPQSNVENHATQLFIESGCKNALPGISWLLLSKTRSTIKLIAVQAVQYTSYLPNQRNLLMPEIAHLLSSSSQACSFSCPPSSSSHSRVCVSDQEFEFNLLATARSQIGRAGRTSQRD